MFPFESCHQETLSHLPNYWCLQTNGSIIGTAKHTVKAHTDFAPFLQEVIMRPPSPCIDSLETWNEFNASALVSCHSFYCKCVCKFNREPLRGSTIHMPLKSNGKTLADFSKVDLPPSSCWQLYKSSRRDFGGTQTAYSSRAVPWTSASWLALDSMGFWLHPYSVGLNHKTGIPKKDKIVLQIPFPRVTLFIKLLLGSAYVTLVSP